MISGVSKSDHEQGLQADTRQGWTSPDGREFGAVGQTDGTAFVEVDKAGKLRYLGRLPTQTVSSPWRDMKVINGYVYIGSEAANHGMQVFDMRKVRDQTSSPYCVLSTHAQCIASESQPAQDVQYPH